MAQPEIIAELTETECYAPDIGYTWRPPEFKFSAGTPAVQYNLPLPNGEDNSGNFMRSARWSPDGLSVLAHCENCTYELYEIPQQSTESPILSAIQPTASLRQPSPILDFLWYPSASRNNPASYCFVASVRECPVKLLEASTGRLRASYKIVDHCERQVAPHSIAFNLTASKLYCGFENAIEVFDVQTPGEGVRLHTTPSRKSKDGLKGIISALAFSPDATYSDAHFAAGSLIPSPHNIVLYSEGQGENPVMFIGNSHTKSYGGVTQLRFHPFKPHILYAAFRGRASHGRIYAWDLRMADSGISNPPYQVLQVYRTTDELGAKAKDLNFNQKMMFDIDITGRWLSLGDQAGRISVFDLSSEALAVGVDGAQSNMDAKISLPEFQFDAHSDAVGSVSFNPCFPFLLSTSGSRHFITGEEGEGDDDGEDTEEAPKGIKRKDRLGPVTFDNSVKVWTLN